VIGIVFAITVVVFGEWWMQGGHHTVAAPAASAHTTK